jgi:hypothetical protein
MDGYEVEQALTEALGDIESEWRYASVERDLAIRALGRFQRRDPDRVEAFAQRLVDEVDGEAGVFNSAIECGTHGTGGASGPDLVVHILEASPAAICRAIILAMPGSDT